MTRHLDRILDYVAALEALDTEGIEPTSHPIPVPLPLRPDRAAAPIDPVLAISNAPEAEGTAPIALHSAHMQNAERRYLMEIIAAVGGDIQEISTLSGLSRSQIYRLIKKHSLTL